MLFYAQRSVNRVHCTFMFTFFVLFLQNSLFHLFCYLFWRLSYCYIEWWHITFFTKIYTSLQSFLRGCISVGEWETETGRPYWPITSSFDHTTLYYVQGFMSSLPQQDVLNWGLPADYVPKLAVILYLPTARLDWPFPDCSYHSWAFAYIISCTHISSQQRDCFHLFTQVWPLQRNLWLTTRSMVNIQHYWIRISFKQVYSTYR